MRRACILAVALTGCGGQQTELAPYGEALVVVDTDLPAPQIAGRLRIDVFSQDGAWLASRDIGRPDPRDWPTSFSVYSDDETRDRRVLVRLRAYPEGSTRDYVGERFETRAAFQEPKVASSLAALCADAPELPMGGRITLRSGGDSLTNVTPYKRCLPPTHSGSVAARVNVARAGSYRFDVATALPYFTNAYLFLRSRCDDPGSQIACEFEPTASIGSSGHFPRFDATLEPGTYWLLTALDTPGWPADITLEVLPVDMPLGVVPEAPVTKTDPRPRLVTNGIDQTPASEPLPSTTVDRLLAVKLVPGERGTVHVTLRGACTSTPALLGADPHVPDLATARTCVDAEDTRVPLIDEPLVPGIVPAGPPSVRGTFDPSEPCAPDAPDASAVCVPGGVFVLGTQLDEATSGQRQADAPPRVAVMRRFWMDRNEVTVARMRAAMAKGLAIEASDLATRSTSEDMAPDAPPMKAYCSYTTTPGDREDDAVSCITWRAARAFCVAEGGDLPTEAQWEYAAMAAGKPRKTLYPWGDDEPTCDRAVYGRAPSDNAWGGVAICPDPGPRPVGAALGDATPLGILGLFGGVGEWMRDSGQSFGSACWGAASLVDPACLEDHAPNRVVRGGSWTSGPLASTLRSFVPGALATGRAKPNGTVPAFAYIGFRCVYPSRP